MIRIGLTGGIGSGKSTVARLLAERGAVVVDADAVAREIVEPGEPAFREIVEEFGPGVVRPDGGLDRGALAAIVFADAAALARLNEITHPRIASRTAELIAAAGDAVVVYDMPLLVENNLSDGWDVVVVVDAPDDVRLRRLVDRGLTYDDAERRMAAQASRAQRLAVADVVIDNAGELDTLTPQINALLHRVGLETRGT